MTAGGFGVTVVVLVLPSPSGRLAGMDFEPAFPGTIFLITGLGFGGSTEAVFAIEGATMRFCAGRLAESGSLDRFPPSTGARLPDAASVAFPTPGFPSVDFEPEGFSSGSFPSEGFDIELSDATFVLVAVAALSNTC